MKRISIKGIDLHGLVFALAMNLTLSSFAQQIQPNSGLKLYDGFDVRLINPAKWYTQWQCGSPSVMECEREIRDRQLHLRVRSYGSTTTSDGNQSEQLVFFLLPPPLPILPHRRSFKKRTRRAARP